MTRTGPGRNYPGVWLYKRRDLPIRVVKKYENWRMIEDPDGTRGWMLVSLLSDRRTAIVKEGEPRPIRVKADENSAVRYRAEGGSSGVSSIAARAGATSPSASARATSARLTSGASATARASTDALPLVAEQR